MTFSELFDRAANSNEVLAVVVAAVLSALGAIAVRLYVGQPRVAWAFSHQHAYTLQGQNGPLIAYTKQIWVQNVGRAVADRVEVILSARPQHFEFWPQRHFEQVENPDNSFMLKLDNLNSREFVTISMFQTVTEPPLVTNVRWNGGVGKQVPMGPQQIYPRWWRILAVCLLILGFFSFWYFAFRLLW